jgi:hypothetical protein
MDKKIENGVKRLLSLGKEVERAADESHYVHTPTQTKLQRCTQWISGGIPLVIPDVWKGCLPIGSTVDQCVRDFFVEGVENMSAFMYCNHMQFRAYEQLIDDLKKFKEEYGDGWHVFADRVFLFSLSLGVAGEVDLLLVNKETGELWIVDMKTSRGGTKSFTKRYKKNEPTKLEKYGLQLNTYRFMAEEMSGLQVHRLSILPIKVFYPPNGSQTDESYFEPIFDVEISDPIEARKSVLNLNDDQ